MSVDERRRMYEETQCSIKKVIDKGLKLDRNIYLNQIVLIKSDIISGDENVKKMALEMLNFLIHLNIEEVEVEFIKMFHDNTGNKLIQECILKSVKQKIVDAVLKDKYQFINILSPWKNQNINKLTNIIEDVCVSNLPRDKCKMFFIDTIIPSMMAMITNNHTRDALIDIAFMMSTILPISDLSNDELESFLKDVNTKYIINIGALRDQEYSNWHNLWIFLVRFCDKHIHHSMDLTNRLLRVVEFAFRNSSIQQRLKGYDCWKELIDNASLDMSHMCSAKQIKLLVTPLKAKFSKQEVVICKRFDVFTYLLEKLQQKAILCLTEFLEFCFGPVGDNKVVNKTGQGKSVPQIWTKSTKVLIELIGHSHDKSISCLSTEDVIKLEKAVVNCSNICNYYKIIINSVGECCALLKEVDIESKRETVIKCMWKSIFDIVIPTSEDNRKTYFHLISEILDDYLKQSLENPYFEDLLILIFSVLMSYNEEFIYEIIEYLIKPLLIILFTIGDLPLNIAEKFRAVIVCWFSKNFIVESKLNFLRDIMVAFIKLKPAKENSTYISNMWICVANELIVVLKSEKIEKFNEFDGFFMWPAYYLHHLNEAIKKNIILHWMKVYRKMATDDNKKLSIMKDLQKIFNDNPLLNSNIVSLLNMMSQVETRFAKEFVNKMMIVSSQILQLPNLKTEEEQKITALVMQYFEPSLECYKDDSNEVTIKNICTCIEHILGIHKNYKLLNTLNIFMKNSPPDLKLKFSKHLSNLLLDLSNKENDTTSYNAKELQKILKVLNVENPRKNNCSSSPFFPPSGRSARIAHMAKNFPRSPQKKGKSVESLPATLRLFGKDPETLSPLHVKGSQLKNITPISRKISNNLKTVPRSSPCIEDEKSADFVLIDTEVKLQPEKLNRHQKEVLKKRREDIPALYQDLSQSLSQDLFSSSSSSKNFEMVNKERSEDTRKVIVEVIGDQFKTDVDQTDIQLHAPFEAPPNISNQYKDNLPNTFSNSALNSNIIPQVPVETVKDFNFVDNLFPDELLTSNIINEEVILQVEKVDVSSEGINTGDNLVSQTVEERITIDNKDSTNVDEKAMSGEHGSDLKYENINLEHKELLKNESQQIEVPEEEKESAKFESEEKKRRGKQRIDLELQKLKMNIVGAEEFLTASRRTRTREKPKKLEEFPKNQSKAIIIQDDKLVRKSLNVQSLESKEKITDKNRRKSIAAIHENIHNIQENLNSPADEKSKFPETPKTRGGRKHLDSADLTPKSKCRQKKMFANEEKIGIGKRDKGKCNNGDNESEDIIESSQDFHVNSTPVFNSSRRKSNVEGNSSQTKQKLNTSQEETLVKKQQNYFPETANDLNNEERIISDITEPKKSIEGTVAETFLAEINTSQTENNLKSPVDIQTKGNTSQDTTMTQESTEDITQLDDDNSQELEKLTDDTDTQQTEIQTQDTLTQSFIVASEDIRPPVLYFDLPKRPELTESERLMCKMDTMSICIDPNLPLKVSAEEQIAEEIEIGSSIALIKNKNLCLEMNDILSTPKSKPLSNLPSSPVTVETPTRTSELLSNTLDISPINSKESSDDGEPDQNTNLVSINFKADMEVLEEIEEAEIERSITDNQFKDFEGFESQRILLNEEETQLTQFQNHIETNETEDFAINAEEVSYQDNQNFDQINAGLLEECHNEAENIPLQVKESQCQPENGAHKMEEKNVKEQDVGIIEGPVPIKDSGIQERASKLLNMVNVNSPMSSHKIFIKKRSITMSPSTARIKRLMSSFNQKSNTEEIPGEVNEEDLLTFTREVPSPLAVPRSSILKRKISDSPESDGISPCAKRKRVNFSDPCLTSKKLFIKDEYQLGVEGNCSFDDLSERKVEEDPTTTDIPGCSEFFDNSERLTETENFESEPTLEMVNPLFLEKDRPIYPKLMDCKENVILILKRVTSPMFITTLMNKLKNKDIKTIGDLAKQSETEIHRLPFKVPVIPNVYKALDNYYKKNIEKFARDTIIEKGDKPEKIGVEESKRENVIMKQSPKKFDLRMELAQLIEKSKTEGTFKELVETVLLSTEKQQLLNHIKSHYKLMQLIEFLTESDFKSVIKDIIQKVGFPNVFGIITDSIQNSEEESVYFDCIVKQSIEKKSLSDLWEKCSIHDIRKGLEESFAKEMFSKEELVNHCLIPLIQNPEDISAYLNQISIVQLSDIVVKRLHGSDTTEFFGQILNSCNDDQYRVVSKELVIRIKSPSDIVGIFQDCIDAQNKEKQNEIMVEMFKYISGKLSVNTLMEVHVDFLKRISVVMANSEK